MPLDANWHREAERLLARVQGQMCLVAYHRERTTRLRTLEASLTQRSADDELADQFAALQAHLACHC